MNQYIPSSNLTIRPGMFNDIPFVQEIAVKTWPLTYNAIIGEAQVNYMLEKLYSSKALEEQMEKQHYFFLALKDYKPVGFASFSLLHDVVYKLQKIYVLPTEQKTGTGKALMDTVETVAKSMGAKKLQLNVNRKNPAKSYYEKNGFRIIKEEDIDIDNGYFMNDYVMEKDL